MLALYLTSVQRYLPQKDLLKFCTENGIHLMAHQPLGGNPVGVVAPRAHIPGPLKDEKVLEIASRNHITPALVLLSWAVQRGTSVVPKSVHPDRIRSNLQIFALSDADFEAVDNLRSEEESVRYLDPRFHIGFNIFSEVADEPVGDVVFVGAAGKGDP
ncbi:hypothetical protein GP486_006114 [Trichoglossum hirsutum]|uniref:NADP-dependent oxidoreductase domain-containing protein n=1 Tax=Trichoglossum hirsutum TaxID=265104 RepID=A0A9P8RL17_9PEZI|nr:hypothetical protein GP486_006114 [Trichoglossum hirsutum]